MNQNKKTSKTKIKQVNLNSLIKENIDIKKINTSSSAFYLSEIEKKYGTATNLILQVTMVAPVLPNLCELIFLNAAFHKLDYAPKLLTSVYEKENFEYFEEFCTNNKIKINFKTKFLNSVLENKTFLSGIENDLSDENLVICFGEGSLSTFQVLKYRQQLLHVDSEKTFKILLWQTAPRPPEACINQRTTNGSLLPKSSREKTLRKEAFRSSDAIICLDKDSANWAYLEGISTHKIKRVNRSIPLNLFSEINRDQIKKQLRNVFNFKDDDFLIFHLGPTELESGSLDTLYGFKTLLSNLNQKSNHIKLIYVSLGQALSDLRKLVLELGIDEHVYFITAENSHYKKNISNKIIQILPIADVVVHSTLVPPNSSSHSHLDVTYEVLIAASYGIPVCSNGTGWIGEWCKRFFPIFSSGNPFSLSKSLNELISYQEKFKSNLLNVKKTLFNEMDMQKASQDFLTFLKSIVSKANFGSEVLYDIDFREIESKIKNQEYIQAIDLISIGFSHKSLTAVSKSKLYRYVADCFTKLGDLESGLQNYLRSLECDPCCSKSYIGLGSIALQQKNPHAAIPQFHKAIGLSPKDDMGYLGLGMAYVEINEKETAYEWCHLACEHNPLNEIAIFQLTQIAFDLNDFSKAIHALESYLNVKPDNHNIRYSLAGLFYESHDFEKAVGQLNTIIKADPTHPKALTLMSKIYKENQKKIPAKHKDINKRRLA